MSYGTTVKVGSARGVLAVVNDTINRHLIGVALDNGNWDPNLDSIHIIPAHDSGHECALLSHEDLIWENMMNDDLIDYLTVHTDIHVNWRDYRDLDKPCNFTVEIFWSA